MVETPYTIQKGQEYTVPYSYTKQKTLDYNISITPTLQKTLDYNAAVPITIQKGLEYRILHETEYTAKYDILAELEFTMRYDIICSDTYYGYLIQAKDRTFDEDNVYEIKGTKKTGEVPEFSFTLHSLSSEDVATYFSRGAQIRIIYNDLIIGDCYITEVERELGLEQYKVTANGILKRLEELKRGRTWIYACTVEEYFENILPSGWSPAVDSDIADMYIEGEEDTASLLDYCENMAEIYNKKLLATQEYSQESITGVTDTTVTVSGAGWDTNEHQDKYVFFISGAAKYKGGKVISNTSDTLSFSGTTFQTDGAVADDKINIYGNYSLLVTSQFSTEPKAVYLYGEDIYETYMGNSTESMATNIYIKGQAIEVQDHTSHADGGILEYTTRVNCDAVLSEYISSSATTIPVISTANWPGSGYFWIEGERIFYQNKTDTAFTECLRGMFGDTPADHPENSSVLNCDIIMEDINDLLSSEEIALGSGVIKNGEEYIKWTEIYTPENLITGLTRSYNNKFLNGDSVDIVPEDGYAHSVGSPIYHTGYRYGISTSPLYWDSTYYGEDNAQPSSLIDTYGRYDYVTDARGTTTRDIIDLYAFELWKEAFNTSGHVLGRCKLVANKFEIPLEVNDYVTIKEDDLDEGTDYKIECMEFDQEEYTIYIEFGRKLDTIFEMFGTVKMNELRGMERKTSTRVGTVIQLSEDGTRGKIEYPDGTTEWVDIYYQ